MKEIEKFEDAAKLGVDLLKVFLIGGISLIALNDSVRFGLNLSHPQEKLYDFSIFFLGFGLIHWWCSDSIAYLYNLNRLIIPFAPKANPRFLRVLGLFLTTVSLLAFIWLGVLD